MASTYSDLKIELIATGEQSGTWGSTTNTNLGTTLEEAITGRAEANFASDADLTLDYLNTNAAQVFRNLILNVTGTISTTRNLIVPTIDKQYLIENNTTGGQSITVKTSAGTGVTVPNGVTAHVYADGTNVVQAVDYFPSLEIDSANIDGGSIDGVTIGTNSAATEVQIDNLNINGNTISSTDTNGNIAITPDGTGEVDISKVDIASGEIDGTNIGANSAGTGNFSTLSISGTAITSTATELNLLDGATGPTGTGNLVLATSPTLTTPDIGTPSAGTLSSCTVDGTNDVGYRNIPAVGTKTGSYTLATGDVGKYVQVGSGGSITIPDATFSEGDVISLFNNTTGDITVTCSITTAYIAGADSDVASVTLATRGVATILFISGTVAVISGNVS